MMRWFFSRTLWAAARFHSKQALRATHDALQREQEQLTAFVWLPVAFGIGILIYFQLHHEPSLWIGLCSSLLSLCAVWICGSKHLILRLFLIALSAICLGFLASSVRTLTLIQPLLSRTMIGSLTGYIEVVEQRSQGSRLIIRVDAFDGLARNQFPERVRVSVRNHSSLQAGDYIYARARLLPLPEAPRPGGYDFARDAFFKGYGSVGSVLGKVSVLPQPDHIPWSSRFTAWVDRGRNALTTRIAAAFGGQEGAVTAALVTGKRGLITEETNDDLRGAGIYHIISISGLHMVLAAGAIFGSLRAFLALFPFLALNFPIKKIAAAGAMCGASAYCVFSGSDVATERSLIMTLVIFGAILVDRPALSLRNLAISALIVLAREPESILSPSFQMSFAAVAGLMAFAVHVQQKATHVEGMPVYSLVVRLMKQALWAIILLFVTTIIATLATAPFSVYHFQVLNPLGLIGNALALPFISFIVMPGAVLGVVLYPFGLDAPVWWVMGLAVQYVLAISAWIASFDGASVVAHAFSGMTLVCFVLALLMSTLLKTFLRLLGLVPLIVGFYGVLNVTVWDILIDRDGQGAAVRAANGRMIIMGRPSSFVVEQWLKASGDKRSSDDESLQEGLKCDLLGCVIQLPSGYNVAFINEHAAFFEDCARADIIISKLYAPSYCKGRHVFDRKRLNTTGSVAIALKTQKAQTQDVFNAPIDHMETTRSLQFPNAQRPWMRPRE